MPKEELVWEGSSSQFVNTHAYLGCGALCAASIPLPMGFAMTVIPAALSISLWYYASTKRMRYQLTNKRLVFENGLVALDIEDVDLLRIRDVKCHQSLLMRLVDIGDIEVVLHSGAVHILRGVAGVRRLRQLIRNAVEERHEQCPRIARTMLYPVDPWAQH